MDVCSVYGEVEGYLRARVGVTQAKLRLLQQTAVQGLDELGEVQANATKQLAHSFV